MINKKKEDVESGAMISTYINPDENVGDTVEVNHLYWNVGLLNKTIYINFLNIFLILNYYVYNNLYFNLIFHSSMIHKMLFNRILNIKSKQK